MSALEVGDRIPVIATSEGLWRTNCLPGNSYW